MGIWEQEDKNATSGCTSMEEIIASIDSLACTFCQYSFLYYNLFPAIESENVIEEVRSKLRSKNQSNESLVHW